MALDFSSIALFPGRRTDARSGARWQCNLSGKRPSIAYGEHVEVRFNDGTVDRDSSNCEWNTSCGFSDRFVGFFRVVKTAAVYSAGSSAPAGVATTGPDVGSW